MSTHSVVTAIKVIEAVSELQPIGLSDLARHLDASKATTLRTLTTLAEMRWLQQGGPTGTDWLLTSHAYAVGVRGGAMGTLREAALGPMHQLQLESTETIHLAIPDGEVLILAERIDTPHALRAFLALGSRIPLHASGTGLAFLSACSDAEIETALSRTLDPVTTQTLTNPAKILAEITAIRNRGYSINVGGLSDGITSLGAPIRSLNGRPIGSVSISGPSSRITPDRFGAMGALVQETALRIGSQYPDL
ncbi:IclR family transcriptional regulator [Leucobacter chinensis]|uniref:IclR family transcriptional regulator n=1 Tax=Leucobacter chinensis TaxID=2851010 RepID=UPI001C21769C|nr:IclR family transcriptional regulator [Leucobacter chinensis]